MSRVQITPAGKIKIDRDNRKVELAVGPCEEGLYISTRFIVDYTAPVYNGSTPLSASCMNGANINLDFSLRDVPMNLFQNGSGLFCDASGSRCSVLFPISGFDALGFGQGASQYTLTCGTTFCGSDNSCFCPHIPSYTCSPSPCPDICLDGDTITCPGNGTLSGSAPGEGGATLNFCEGINGYKVYLGFGLNADFGSGGTCHSGSYGFVIGGAMPFVELGHELKGQNFELSYTIQHGDILYSDPAWQTPVMQAYFDYLLGVENTPVSPSDPIADAFLTVTAQFSFR